MTQANHRRPWSPYLFAGGAIAAAWLLRVLIDPLVGDHVPFETFFAAVATVVWFTQSLRAACLAVVAGYLVSTWCFVEPRGSFALDNSASRMSMLTYFLVTLTFVAFGRALRRARARSEKLSSERNEQRERLRVTLASIGDGVLTCDQQGHVTYLNGVAEALTGWSSQEAAGRPLTEVFQIVNTHSRETVANPADESLRKGTVERLPGGTVLLARDGVERPIDDSAAPIRDASGQITGTVLIFRDVSHREATETALRESQAQHRALTAQVRDFAIFTIDVEGRPRTWNEGVERVLGFTQEEFIGREIVPIIFTPEDVRAGVPQAELATATRDGVAGNDRWMRRKSGERFFAQGSTNSLRDEAGRLLGFTKVMRDSTDLNKTEQALQESEKRFRTMADHAPVKVWVTDAAGRCTYLNRRWYDFTGQTPEEALGFGWLEAVHADDRPGAEQAFIQANERREGFRLEYRLRHHDGSYRWSIDAAMPRFGGDNEFLGYVGSVLDIADRKRTEEALRESQERLQKALSVTTVGVLFFRLDGTILDANATFERLSGYTAEELRSTTHWQQLTAPDFLDATSRAALDLAERGVTPPYEKQMLRKDGSRWWGLFAPTRLRAVGRDSECIEFIIDITERRAAEAARRESEERFRTLFDSAPIAVFVCDRDAVIQHYNRLAVELLGREPLSGLERRFGTAHLWQLDGTPLPPADNPVLEVLRDGVARSAEVLIERSDAARVPVLMNFAALRDAQGAIAGAIASFVDISERKRAEELLRSEAARLETLVQQRTAKLQDAIGELEAFSYSMAHDLRGPLRSLTGLTNLLREDNYAQLDANGRDYVNRIGRAAARMHALVRDVLTYSQLSRQALTLQPVALDSLVKSVREQYTQLEQAHIQVLNTLPTVLGHEAALTQVFSNLLSNAAKFVPAGRGAEIEIEAVDDAGGAGDDAAPGSGGMVTIWIRDNGIGIAPENLERIFHMFERLHSPHEYEGTGIGLAIVRRVVERMGGTVGVESALGQGSRFWVKLRRA